MDKEADAQCIALLREVEGKRKELRALESALTEATRGYAKRRGYYGFFGEWNLRNTIEIEQRLEDAADRNDWEKANA